MLCNIPLTIVHLAALLSGLLPFFVYSDTQGLCMLGVFEVTQN